MENKKIKGTVQVDYDGIHFKSKLERTCYRKLKEAGYTPEYEPIKFPLWEKTYLSDRTKAFLPDSKNKKVLSVYTRPLLAITYTPDFLVRLNDATFCYFDAKGFANDRYPLKKKMFLGYLDRLSTISEKTYLFFEVHSVAHILQAIQTMKAYENT